MAITQKSRIKVRHGLQEELPQLATGELGWALDSRRLFIGNGTADEGAPTMGNTEILTIYSDVSSIGLNSAAITLSSSIVPIGIYSPLANTLAITSRTADVLRLANPISAINSLSITGGISGTGPTISSYGEANQDVRIAPNGSGNVVIANGTLGITSLTENHIVYVDNNKRIQSADIHYTGVNLGIGVQSDPLWTGDVTTIQLETSALYSDKATGTFVGANTVKTTSGNVSLVTGAATIYAGEAGEHKWYTVPSVTAGAVQTPVLTMVLNTTNTLGIGVNPNVLPAGQSGIQLLSTLLKSNGIGNSTLYNNCYDDIGIDRYSRTSGASNYRMTPLGHSWTVSNGMSHLIGDEITWLPPILSITSAGVVVGGDLTVNGTTTTTTTAIVAIDDPTFVLGGATSTVEITKDRGIEFKWNGTTLSIVNFISDGSTTIIGTVADTTGFATGDIITITGAVGTEETNLNGTWKITLVNGTTFSFVVTVAPTAATYTTSIGTTVKSKNGFMGFDQSTGYLTFIPQVNNINGVMTGTTGDIVATNFRGSLIGNADTATVIATPRSIYGNNFNGSAGLTQVIASTYGGTGNGFAKFAGPTTTEKTYTLPDASTTILTTNALVTSAQGGTGNGFAKFAGATTTEKTYTLPDVSTTILTTNALITSAQGGTGNEFTRFTGPTTVEKVFTLPDATATILTTNALVTSEQGGTGNGFAKFAGPTTTEKTYTLPDASTTILTTNALVTSAQGGTGNGFAKFAGATTTEKTYTLPDVSTTILTTNALVTSAQGGTSNGFTKFTGPATTERTFTLPNASATILTTNALVTSAQGGTGNGFAKFSGPTTTEKTYTLPDATATILTTNALVTSAQGGTGNGFTKFTGPTTTERVFVLPDASATILTTSDVVPVAQGGTGSTFVGFTGPTVTRTFTLPNASAAILTTNAPVTVSQGGTGVASLTGILQGNGLNPVSTANTTGTGSVVLSTGAAVGGTWTAASAWVLPAFTLSGAIAGAGNQINNVVIGTTTPLAGYFTSLSATSTSSFAAGSVSAPGVYLAADNTSGLYRIGANNIGVTISGVNVVDISSTGLIVAGNVAASNITNSIVTASGATYSVLLTDSSVISNYAGTQTLTLPSAAAYTGRVLHLRTITANTVVSASSNVVPMIGGAAGTAILAATAGKWAMLQSDGTDWQVMAGN